MGQVIFSLAGKLRKNLRDCFAYARNDEEKSGKVAERFKRLLRRIAPRNDEEKSGKVAERFKRLPRRLRRLAMTGRSIPRNDEILS